MFVLIFLSAVLFLRILRNKLGTKIFEPDHLMKALSGDRILPKLREYNYYHEAGSKPELVYSDFVILLLFIR